MANHLNSRSETPRRVVLIGGSGFIGKAVANELISKQMPALSLSSKEVNLLETSSVEKLLSILQPEDTVIFLSALTPDKGKDSEAMMKNFRMARCMEKALSEKSISHLIYVSSDAVFDDAVNPIRETSPKSSGALYGLMHRGREIMMESVTRAHKIPFLILRPSAVYGAGDTHKSYGPNRFIRTAITEKKISFFGGGEEKRDHLYIKDLARIIVECILHKTTGELNIATGYAVPFSEVAKHIQRAFKALDGTHISIHPSSRRGEPTHRHFDNKAFILAFPAFLFTDLAKGIEESLAEEVRKVSQSVHS